MTLTKPFAAPALVGLALALWPYMAAAQSPLSAIDWLSDSIRTPEVIAEQPPGDIGAALPGDITVNPIDGPNAEAVGLLPVSVTGLPADFWANSSARVIARALRRDRGDVLPAVGDLIYLLLLAELDPPLPASAQPELLLARIDALLALGAVEQADALLDRVGVTSPEIFRRAFDVALLLRAEDEVCAELRSLPSLSPTFPARIFCLARGGDWAGAALSLETGRALGFVTQDQDALLARFLDLGLDETTVALPLPSRPSPLEFRMYEAIGRPLPTINLPRAFAHSDLHAASGWKNQIEAAERLTRTGAIDPNRLMGAYTDRRPAASGGVWDRAAAIQALDGALLSQQASAISPALQTAWDQMALVGLEVAFAKYYCQRLRSRQLTASAAALRFRICLLGTSDHRALRLPPGPDDVDRFVFAIARGEPLPTAPQGTLGRAIHAGFAGRGYPDRFKGLMRDAKSGEAVLRAVDFLQAGASGDLDDLADALIFLRAAGFENVARQSAIELMLLDRQR